MLVQVMSGYIRFVHDILCKVRPRYVRLSG